jgi:hypothetical protein
MACTKRAKLAQAENGGAVFVRRNRCLSCESRGQSGNRESRSKHLLATIFKVKPKVIM